MRPPDRVRQHRPGRVTGFPGGNTTRKVTSISAR